MTTISSLPLSHSLSTSTPRHCSEFDSVDTVKPEDENRTEQNKTSELLPANTLSFSLKSKRINIKPAVWLS